MSIPWKTVLWAAIVFVVLHQLSRRVPAIASVTGA